MIFMSLILLFSLTSFSSLSAMGWLGYWTNADYQKHMAFAMAYANNSFKLEQQKEPILIIQIYSPDKKVTLSWSIPEAQKAFNTIITNKYAGFSNEAIKQFVQTKKDEEAWKNGTYKESSSPANQPKETVADAYNLFCGYLQWQIKRDEKDTRPYADDATKNRKDLRKALLEKNIELLKEVQKKPAQTENFVTDLIQTYIREEAERAIKAYEAGSCIIL